MTKLAAFVFDLDGTLLNTLADIATACNAVLAGHGYPQHPLSAYNHMVGNGFTALIARALPEDRPPDAAALARLVEEGREYYASHMMNETAPYPGMREALAELEARGDRLAVLSNKPDAMSVALIRHYFPKITFAAIQGARPDVPLKPDPTTLLTMLREINGGRKEATYVGDSNVDMETAHNASVYAIGVSWGFRGSEELEEAGADRIIQTPADLQGLTIPAILPGNQVASQEKRKACP